jgi:hypothetical protein
MTIYKNYSKFIFTRSPFSYQLYFFPPLTKSTWYIAGIIKIGLKSKNQKTTNFAANEEMQELQDDESMQLKK